MIISIITPSFNQGAYIEDTIRSVISQKGDFIIDYIIMDGGSNDRSLEIIKKYSSLIREEKWHIHCRDIQYRWYSERDRGQVDAIEKGFVIAQGDIASWLNSDDVLHDPMVLERVSMEFRNNPQLDMLTADGLLIDRQGQKFGVHQVDTINFDELLYLDYHILQPATFISRNVYTNERLDRTYNYCFDAEYFIRLIAKGYRYKKANDRYACFRLYAETKTLSGLEKRYKESMEISRRYGKKRHISFISAIYKYFDIVLQNKYHDNIFIHTFTNLLRVISYQVITHKARR